MITQVTVQNGRLTTEKVGLTTFLFNLNARTFDFKARGVR